MIRRRYCPKSNPCEAPVCPLDPDWKSQTQMTGDQVCLYLSSGEQIGDLNHVDPDAQVELEQMITEFIIELNAKYGRDYIRQKLREAEQPIPDMAHHKPS